MLPVNKIIRGGLSVLQLCCMIGAYVLDDLSYKKVGVNHHVMFVKRQYMETLLRPEYMTVYRLLAAVLLIALGVYVIRCPRQSKGRRLVPFTLATAGLALTLTVPGILLRPAYAFLLLLMGCIWLLEMVKLWVAGYENIPDTAYDQGKRSRPL